MVKILSDIVKKRHLRAIHSRLSSIKEDVEGILYWNFRDEKDIEYLGKESIKKHFTIIKKHLNYLSDKF